MGEFSPGLSIPPPSKLKPTGDEVAGSLPTALSTSPLADYKAFEFGVLWFRLLATLPLLQAQLKETYGPRFFQCHKEGSLATDLADEMRFSEPLSLTVKITSRVCVSTETSHSAIQGECAIVLAGDFCFICKLCMLHATEYRETTHPGLLVDTQNV